MKYLKEKIFLAFLTLLFIFMYKNNQILDNNLYKFKIDCPNSLYLVNKDSHSMKKVNLNDNNRKQKLIIYINSECEFCINKIIGIHEYLNVNNLQNEYILIPILFNSISNEFIENITENYIISFPLYRSVNENRKNIQTSKIYQYSKDNEFIQIIDFNSLSKLMI